LIHQAYEEFLKIVPTEKWSTPTTDVDLPVPKLADLLKTFQDPVEADKIAKIQKDLDQTKALSSINEPTNGQR